MKRRHKNNGAPVHSIRLARHATHECDHYSNFVFCTTSIVFHTPPKRRFTQNCFTNAVARRFLPPPFRFTDPLIFEATIFGLSA